MRRYLHVWSAVDPGTGITYFRNFDDGTAGGVSWWIGMRPLQGFLDSINYGFLISQSMDIARIINGETGYQITLYKAEFDPSEPAKSGTHGNPDYSGYKEAREEAGTAGPTSGPQSPNIDFKSIAQYLATLYALTYQRGCIGYSRTILSALEAAIKQTVTQAQVDAAATAYNACLDRS